jgi:hypothetical protein
MRAIAVLLAVAAFAAAATAQVVPGAPTDPVQADGERAGVQERGREKGLS